MRNSISKFGRADQLDVALGLDIAVASKLGSIIIFVGSIEYHLERTIWNLEGVDPRGIRPITDGKQASELIAMLESLATGEQEVELRELLVTWISAMRSGLIIRHNIAHGVASKIGTTMILSRNPRWQGEERKRDFSDLWCRPDTLDLIRDSFATLLRVIVMVAKARQNLTRVRYSDCMSALRQARSILGEFSDKFYNPSFEKY